MGCKVDRTTDRFDVAPTGGYDELDEELLARWHGRDGYEEFGYRVLTTWFNKRVLKQVYDAHGRATLGTRVESDYEALTGDDDLLRAEVCDDLRADGIDAEAVVDGLVSWSTMRHHLNDCLEDSKEQPSRSSDWERESVRIAADQAADKAKAAVRSLAAQGDLVGGDEAQVSVETYLTCPECNLRVSLQEARTRGYVCADHLGAPDDDTVGESDIPN